MSVFAVKMWDEREIYSRLIRDYLQIEKPELLSNGGFDTDTVWSYGGAWKIDSGVASYDATADSDLVQTKILWPSTVHTLTFTISGVIPGTYARIRIEDGLSATLYGAANYSNGTYTLQITTGTDLDLHIVGLSSGVQFSVDNASAKPTRDGLIFVQGSYANYSTPQNTTPGDVYVVRCYLATSGLNGIRFDSTGALGPSSSYTAKALSYHDTVYQTFTAGNDSQDLRIVRDSGVNGVVLFNAYNLSRLGIVTMEERNLINSLGVTWDYSSYPHWSDITSALSTADEKTVLDFFIPSVFSGNDTEKLLKANNGLLDLSRVTKRDSLQELRITGEGRLLWDYRASQISLEFGKGIWLTTGLETGDTESLVKRRIDIHWWNSRKFSGFIRRAEWDKKTQTLTTEIDSAGLVIKDLIAGIPIGDTQFNRFRSMHVEEGTAWQWKWTGAYQAAIASMSVYNVLEYLTYNINHNILAAGYEGALEEAPTVNVHDFVLNYTFGAIAGGFNSQDLESGETVVSIVYDSIGADEYLITRQPGIGGFYAYYRRRIEYSGISTTRELIGYPGSTGINALGGYRIDGDPMARSGTFYAVDVSQPATPTVAVYHWELDVPPAGFWQFMRELLDDDSLGISTCEGLSCPMAGDHYFAVMETDGERVVVPVEKLQLDRFIFDYDDNATVGQVLKDLGVISDSLVGFDYSNGSGYVGKLQAINRGAGDNVQIEEFLDFRRSNEDENDSTFSMPAAYEDGLLDEVAEEIRSYFENIQNAGTDAISAIAHRRKISDLDAIKIGAKATHPTEGNLGIIREIVFRENVVELHTKLRTG